MTRILLVETASPKRICQKVEQILNAGAYLDPEIAILCSETSLPVFMKQPGVNVYPWTGRGKHRTLRELKQKKFDVLYAFWTGETQYRRMKFLALRLRVKQALIIAGDGNEFRLTWKTFCRHAVFRSKHPLPTDHYDFVPQPGALPLRDSRGSPVLVVQSAEPAYVLRALERLREKPLFPDPRYTLFCRNRPEVVRSFQGHPMLDRVLTHSEAHSSWKHLRDLRRRKFVAIVMFMTGDPSYRKIKLFAFLLGVRWRHILIFNESNDGFFFNFSQWLSLVTNRVQGSYQTAPRWSNSVRFPVSLMIKGTLLPFRFLWLLLVWLRLRFAGLRS